MKKEYLSLPMAIFWIFLSVVLLSGSSFFLLHYYKHFLIERRNNPSYRIETIIQTGDKKEALKTVYLAELMDLSSDKPSNYYTFDPHGAEKKLLQSPLVKTAFVKKIKPNTVYVDYTVREPIAWLGDYENILIDEEGRIFPAFPFLSPKTLPKIYLNFSDEEETIDLSFGNPLKDKYTLLALRLMKEFTQPSLREKFRLISLDVSKAFAPSLGKREIVVEMEEEWAFSEGEKRSLLIFPKYLRFSPNNYSKQMGNFLSLQKKMKKDYEKQLREKNVLEANQRFLPKIIDLRIDSMAFIDEN
jgi:hypothetical protein